MAEHSPFLKKTGTSTLIMIHVQPRASMDRIIGLHGDRLKVQVKAPPVDSKANTAVQKLLSKILKIPKSKITLKSGASSRQKTFLIEGIGPAQVFSRLNI